MTHDEAIKAAEKLLYLVGRKFRLMDGETETVKTVVAWQQADGSWLPHICFYDWEKNEDGKILHLPVDEFIKTYQQLDGTPAGGL
jgi:hypothetical protein